MSTVAGRMQESALARRFRFAEHGTTLGRDAMAGATRFIVMSYIIFVNPFVASAAFLLYFVVSLLQDTFDWI